MNKKCLNCGNFLIKKDGQILVIIKDINAKIAQRKQHLYENASKLHKSINDSGLEAEFTHLKTKLRVYSGLKLENKKKFIFNYFRLKNDER